MSGKNLDGNDAVEHEPGDAEQLAAHVLRLDRDSQLSADMGARGRRWLELYTDETQWQSRFAAIAAHAIAAR